MGMSSIDIAFRRDTATPEVILQHLRECSDNFVPPLAKELDIYAYSEKIAEFAVLFEAWNDFRLVGLVAAYLNEDPPNSGFITNVSTLTSFSGRGIAKKLIENCLDVAAERGFSWIGLEVRSSNAAAIGLYQKLGFTPTGSSGGKLTMARELNK